ncbi:MAG: hypothetical protein INH41_03390 [Myxococcaceae bacterium]|nr:hypothetical protein [Myxococcaceae bacterium]MCA3011423.1 hypothetical protein [Myxococcaceae bacterium]
MRLRGLAWPLASYVAAGVNKVALLGYQLALGGLGGPEGLGAHATVVAVAGLAGGVLHAGLPDWALYRAAEAKAEGRALPAALGSGHGLFLASAALAYVGVGVGLGALVPTGTRAYAGAVLVGLFLPHLSAFSSSTLRGLGAPRREALATLWSAVALGVAALTASSLAQLGVGFVVAGGCLSAPLGWGLRDGAMRPRLEGAAPVLGRLREGLPYLALGLGWMALWTADTLVTRAVGATADVGLLAASVMVLHGGLYGSSLFGALLVHRVRGGAPGARLALVGLGPLLALVGVVASWGLHGLLARRFGVDEAALRGVLGVASALAPVGYTATLWMPVAIGLEPRRVRLALAGGLLAAAVVGAAVGGRGATGGLWAMGAGQAVVLAVLGPLVLRGGRPGTT